MPELARLMGERREIYGLHRDGHEFPAEASISKLAVGDAHLFPVILRDVTARKRVTEELERQVQQRTARLNTLLAVSRELFGARGQDAVFQRALAKRWRSSPMPTPARSTSWKRTTARLSLRAGHGFKPVPGINLC